MNTPKLIFLIPCIFLFAACSHPADKPSIISADHLQAVQHNIDSAAALYAAAIADVDKGMTADAVTAKYKAPISWNHEQVKKLLTDMGTMLQQGKLTEDECNKAKSTLHFEAVRQGRDVLRQKGIILVEKSPGN